MRDRMIFLRTQDQTDRRIFAVICPVFTGIIEIQMHLPRVSVSKLAEFEIDDDKTAQLSMEEQEVHPVPLTADPEASLTSDKSKIASEFQKEVLPVQDRG